MHEGDVRKDASASRTEVNVEEPVYDNFCFDESDRGDEDDV
jgi:hypothetical protein